MSDSPELIIVHSTVSGKDPEEVKKKRIMNIVESALGSITQNAKNMISYASSVEDITKIVRDMIANNVPKVAIDGGDGFATLFFNIFFKLRKSLEREDYRPDVLFLAGGTGNAVSFCSKFKNPLVALKNLYNNKYKTEPLNLLKVKTGNEPELALFVGFGGDTEVLEIYRNQKRKGFFGYLIAVFKYAFSRKLYNPFSKNDANYTLDIEKDGTHIHRGKHEGGGISAIPFVGYGFRTFPLARKGISQIRFVLYGAFLMPTMFILTKWNFLKRPNRLIYDYKIDRPTVLNFSFDREVPVQVSGDIRGRHSHVEVEFSQDETLNLVKRAG
ncbi:MAG TPA: hypothetical protein PLN69_05800 [bacterium]|nr:hypothetical protein [bacterium]